MSNDARWMRQALALAAARAGVTAPNPAVCCVLVKDGGVLAEAATAPGGRPHAEEQALAGVVRVVVGCEDPSPYASGRGLQRLAAAGVPVTLGVLETDARALVADWLALHGEPAKTR